MESFTERIAQLPPDKRKVLELLLRNGAVRKDQSLSRSASAKYYPLSFAQQRLWFIQQLDPESSAYNMPGVFEIEGELSVAALERSLNTIIERHQILRTAFRMENGEPVQVVSPSLRMMIPVIDLSQLSRDAQRECINRLRLEEAQRAFDLNRCPLLRAQLLRLSKSEHLLLITMHHIVSDGGSVTIFVRELKLLYEAMRSGGANPFPALPIQYADFAIWQREHIRGELLEKQIGYWKNQLTGISNLPLLHRNRTRSGNRGTTQSFELPLNVSRALNAIAREQRATPFMTLLAVFKTLLCCFSGQEDIVVGSSVTNRTRVDTEQLIGCFLNILPLRTDLSGDPGFFEVLRRVREVVLAAYANSDVPFDKVVETLRPERRSAQVPLIEVLFEFAKSPVDREPERSGLSLKLIKSGFGKSKFALTLFMSDGPNGLRGTFEYNPDWIEAATIKSFTTLLQLIAQNIAADPTEGISMLARMSDARELAFQAEFNSRL